MTDRCSPAFRACLAVLWLSACARSPEPPLTDAGAGSGAAASGSAGRRNEAGGSAGTRGPSAGTRGESDADAGEPPDGGVAALGSAGCTHTGGQYAAGTTAAELSHAGSMRSFRVHVPRRYESGAPMPLLLMLHGGGGSARQFEEASAEMDPIAEREGFITVYPDGTGALRSWNGGGCCGAAVTNAVDDVGFVGALLDHLTAELCVDERRVFASGMSNGAIMAHRLACELSGRIAAIAPVSGTDMTATCEPQRSLSVLQIHGTADGHVPWDGGVGCGPSAAAFTSVPETMERWRKRSGCSAEKSESFTEGDGRCESYTGCAAASDVTLCAIAGGGHSWPGGKPPADLVDCPGNGMQSTSFEASEVIWRFLRAHPRVD